MNRENLAGVIVTLSGLLVWAGPPALADAGGDTEAELLEAVRALRAEVAALKTEVEAVRGNQRKILAELAVIKRTAAATAQRPRRKPDTTVYNVAVGDSAIRGPSDAPVTVVEFGSATCGWCMRETPMIKRIMAAYPKDVRFMFKHRVRNAQDRKLHAAMELARRQKGAEAFWAMHDKVMGDKKGRELSDLRALAGELGMDLAEFDATMADSSKWDALLAADMKVGNDCKVSGTPTILINGLKLAGRRTFENYKARIDAILAEKKKGGK